MGQHSDRAREALLDAAEELFAQHGIDAVSNRRITEHAGTANHSAIKYHFDGRDGLMRALLSRGRESMGERRAQLVAALPEPAPLRDVIATQIMPWVEFLDSLPSPSWHARFLFQVASVPSVAAVLADAVRNGNGFESLIKESLSELEGIPSTVLRGRAGVLGGMILGLCAEHEAQIEEGSARGTWTSVGYFLVDAAAGMLAAPVTHPADFITAESKPSSFPL